MSVNIEQMRLEEKKKSAVIAYIMWWFLGLFGAHRFYMGKSNGATMLIISILSFLTMIIVVGYIGLLAMLVWWVLDAISLHKWVTTYNLELINNYEKATVSANN
ncbi:NINE protein [Candidatus Sulfurimonas baltica]|uniref:TM2 domain-containing protein n=1 Tax=Candidatus Sulfurimonas baltica TaxID=2740404 RepID=A0A7S7LW50_9BACT|nr:TM2 domain-containing protein [Candidatus Sulfurimonas baltica]QOY52490.1 TM2 domain-containing protein [Candidatus Sulfurimonas baltica]